MRPLYEIENDILGCVDTDTGEIVDENKLNELEMEREKKIEGIILWRKDLMAEADAVKAEAQKLSARAKVCENKAEQLRKYIEHALDGEKFKTERCSVSYRKTTSVSIDDYRKIDSKYWKDFREDWISKSALKQDLEKGVEIDGAHLEEKNGIVIK